MLRFVFAATLFAIAACSPTFDWRQVRAESVPLKAMMPCKPDKAARTVPMAGRQVELKVLGCEAGGATFAVMTADIVDPLRAGEVLAQWRVATLANLRIAPDKGQDSAFLPPGAMALAQSKRVKAAGQRADGTAVESQAVYFARGPHVVQALVFADKIPVDAAETFFASLAFE